MSQNVVNSYRFGSSYTMDDTGLVCYYKFDESSLSVPNSSQSSESGGSNFDGTGTGATYSTAGHFGNCFSFDGADDFFQCDISGGVNFSQWNFLHNGGDFSICYWLRRIDDTEQGRLFDQLYDGGATLGNGITQNVSYAPSSWAANMMVTNSSAGRPLDATFSSAYYNDENWHFYTHTCDWSTPNGFVSTVDNANTHTGGVTGGTPDNVNATTNMTIMRTVGSGQNFAAEIQELSFWSVVIPQGNIDYMWNDGVGQGIYP